MCGEGGGRNHREGQGLWSAEGSRPHLKAFQFQVIENIVPAKQNMAGDSAAICPLAQSVTSGSSLSLSKRGLPLAAYYGNKPGVPCLDEARAGWLDHSKHLIQRANETLSLGLELGTK